MMPGLQRSHHRTHRSLQGALHCTANAQRAQHVSSKDACLARLAGDNLHKVIVVRQAPQESTDLQRAHREAQQQHMSSRLWAHVLLWKPPQATISAAAVSVHTAARAWAVARCRRLGCTHWHELPALLPHSNRMLSHIPWHAGPAQLPHSDQQGCVARGTAGQLQAQARPPRAAPLAACGMAATSGAAQSFSF